MTEPNYTFIIRNCWRQRIGAAWWFLTFRPLPPETKTLLIRIAFVIFGLAALLIARSGA